MTKNSISNSFFLFFFSFTSISSAFNINKKGKLFFYINTDIIHVKACGISSCELCCSGSRASDAHLSRGCCDCEARAQYETWTIHRVNGQTSITSKSKSVFLSFRRVSSIRVSHKRCILFYSACMHV